MSEKNNLIDSFLARRKAQVKSENHKNSSEGAVFDMSQRREEILESERRAVRRTILSEFIGVTVVIPGEGLRKVSLYDISQGGLSFDMGEKEGQFHMNEEVAMRVYMNHKTYFPFVIKVANIRAIEDEGVVRHGAVYVQGSINDQALGHFVKFIETVSASLITDLGDVMVSNLSK